MNYIQKIHTLLDKQTKKQLLWLVVFSVFLSLVEVTGVSAIMPFIDIAINFESIHSNPYYQWLFDFFNFRNDVDFAIAFGLFLFGFYLFRGGVNLLYSYIIAHFTQGFYAQTTKKLFKTYLAMPYQLFTNKNSSYLTKAIVTEASLVSVVIKSVLIMLSEIFVVLFLFLLMLIASWKITLVFSIILIIKLFFLTKIVSNKIKKVGAIRAKTQAEFFEIINRVFGNFENIKLQDNNRLIKTNNDFLKMINRYAKASAMFGFLEACPRLLMETVGFSLIIFMLIFLMHSNLSDISYIMPTLSFFILAMYRLLPSVNRIVTGYNSLMYYHKSIDIVNEELKTPQENLSGSIVKFKDKIELINVDFSYQGKSVLSNINVTINKGEKIAFVGESGSGKSTLVNLIIGLYQPDQGEVKVDNTLIDQSNLQHWRSQIGYIPQQVYLFDGTIAENVCFGRKLDETLLDIVLIQANIIDFLQTKEGIDTLVGEGGIQLSGGQKQRIAIARALYGQPEILVLDEATSALDEDTEKKIMNQIYQVSQNKTLIVVAHRLSTIKVCDKIIEMKDGQLIC